jgi:hypothetical protein
MVLAVVILLVPMFILLWAVTYYFLPSARATRLIICFGFLVALMGGYYSDFAPFALVVAVCLIGMEWTISRAPK